ncbi:hypothetical protein [Desulfitibacter alkalitolerans]|nr:hypothetical protein [Desulfitibacter alkalitolerans]
MSKIKILVDTNIFISAYLGSKKAKFLIKEILMDEDKMKFHSIIT